MIDVILDSAGRALTARPRRTQYTVSIGVIALSFSALAGQPVASPAGETSRNYRAMDMQGGTSTRRYTANRGYTWSRSLNGVDGVLTIQSLT